MAAAATRTPSRSSTRKAAHAQMSRQAPAQTSAHNGRENQTHGQRRAGRMVHGQITQESVCAVEISLRKPCTKRHPARRTKRTVSGTPHQTDGIRHAAPNGRYPVRRTKRTVSGTPHQTDGIRYAAPNGRYPARHSRAHPKALRKRTYPPCPAREICAGQIFAHFIYIILFT